MQEAESAIVCVGSLITCCNQSAEVIPSILESSCVALSPLNQRFDLGLKSPRTINKKVLVAVAASRFNSKSSCDWLGEGYKDTNLPPIYIIYYIIYLLFLFQN